MIRELSLNDFVNYKTDLLTFEEIENELKANPFGHFLVYIEQENNIIGYLYYSDIYERAEINQIEVEVFHRNCGIATKLLQKMITLEVKVTNNSAIHLYKKFGFCETAIRKGYYQGIDGILMERKNNN